MILFGVHAMSYNRDLSFFFWLINHELSWIGYVPIESSKYDYKNSY